MKRKVDCQNKGAFTSLSQFEPKQRPNGKTTLGTGSFGQVTLYQHIKTQSLYAIKCIQSNNIQTSYEQEGIEREIKVHSKCHHKNIVNLFDSFQENANVYMVMEYIENGNLYNYVQKRKRLDEKEACKFFIQTCKALEYLHINNIFHRDIKPENLLLDSNFDLKLCDFGWCAENIHLKRKTFCGTYEYMAPEIVSDQAYDYTIDIWSVGVLLYELLHGYAPFKGKEYKEIAANIKLGQIKFSSSIQADAIELITSILQKDPKERISFKQIFASKFVNRLYQQPQQLQISSGLKVAISPRTSQSIESLQKYQSPMISHKHQPQGRINQQNNNTNTINTSITNSSISLKSPTLTKNNKKSNSIFEDIKKKILFDQQSPLRDATNLSRRKVQPSLSNIFKSSNSNCKVLGNGNIHSNHNIYTHNSDSKRVDFHSLSKSKKLDENCQNRLLEQFRSMPSIQNEEINDDPMNNFKTDRTKCAKQQSNQDLDKILKMYLSMCSSRQ